MDQLYKSLMSRSLLIIRYNLLLSILFAQQSFAQELDRLAIRFHFQNQSLKSALQELEKTYDLTFSYEERLIENKIIQNIQVENLNLEKAIHKILHPYPLAFELLPKGYIIIKEDKEKNIPIEHPKPKLCGILLDSLSNRPLPFGNILIKNTTLGANTNGVGYFELVADFKASDTLIISYLGYKPQQIAAFSLKSSGCNSIFLKPDLIAIPNILIEDQAISLLRASSTGDGFYFQPNQMTILPGWGDNDLLRMAQLVPGVSTIDESASRLHIRGGTPDQNLVLWDGIPIYHTGHLFGMFSAFNPAAAHSMKVHTGGLSARYGERIAGRIDISSKPSQLDSFELELGFNLVSAHSFLQIPLWKGKSAIAISARRSYTDLIQSNTYQNLFNQVAGNGKIQDQQESLNEQEAAIAIDFTLDPKFFYSDWNTKWVFQPNERSTFSWSVYQGNDVLDYILQGEYFDFYVDSRDQINLQNWGTSFQWEQQWNTYLQSETRFLHSDFNNVYDFQATFDKSMPFQARHGLDNRMQEWSMQQNLSWRVSPLHTVHFGFHHSIKQLHFDWHLEVIDRAVSEGDAASSKAHLSTFYIDYDLNITERFSLDFGTRINWLKGFSKEGWEPRLSLDWQAFNVPLHFKASTSRSIQIVSQMLIINELGLGEQLWFLNTEDQSLPFIEASEFSAGCWFQKDGWLVDLEFYNKTTRHLTSLNLRFSQSEGYPYSRGNAFAKGIDLLIKKRWKKYSSWLSYSLASVNYSFANLENAKLFPADHDQRHRLNWTHQLKIKNWAFAVSWLLSSGRPFTDVSNIAFETNPNTGEAFPYLEYGLRNSKRLPSYHRLDLSANYQLKTRTGQIFRFGLSALNVYDRSNILEREFWAAEQDGNARIFSYDRPMLGFTPNFFFSFQY